MKITVKETRVLKTGENRKGKWELIKVTSDDGTEYTTFDKKAKHLNPGAVFEAEVELKEGKASFAEVGTIISQGEAKPQSQSGSTNASIESQVGQKGGIETLKVLIEQALLTDAEIKECKAYAMASVRWGMSRVNLLSVIVAKIEEAKGETVKANKSSQEAKTKSTDKQNSGEAIKNAGELFNWLMSKDKTITSPRAWLEVECDVSHGEVLTIGKIQELFKAIKKDKGW